MEYRFTMTGAIDAAKHDSLESWLHSYLRGEGNNVPFSDGLKLTPRQYGGPLQFPLRYLSRCTGPEEHMSYRVGVEEFERRVGAIGIAMESGYDLPPLIVNYSEQTLQVNDGNHRLEALVRNNVHSFGVIVWTTAESDWAEFQDRFRAEYEELA